MIIRLCVCVYDIMLLNGERITHESRVYTRNIWRIFATIYKILYYFPRTVAVVRSGSRKR